MSAERFTLSVSEEAFQSLKAVLITRTGLSYYADKEAELAAVIGARMGELRIPECKGYLNLLNGDEGEQELWTIVTRLTIGETYFFRHTEQFDALRDIVLPELLSLHSTRRSLTLWSAGCANGAEPYSLSVLLRRDLGHLTEGWNIRIVGSDINGEYLRAAEAGVFGDWSLRCLPDDIRRQCFQPNNGKWEIAPQYREGVSFRRHNLAADPDWGFGQPDLILCRNVMIYFNQDLIPRLVDQFYDLLAPGGWLVVGHAEANVDQFHRFHTRNAPGTTLFQKPCLDSGETPRRIFEPISSQSAGQPEFMAFAAPDVGQSPSAPPRLMEGDGSWPAVEEFIHSGDWQSADALCSRLLAIDQVDSRGHFLKAVILESAGQSAEAQKSLRRSIYLNRGFAGAHYKLAAALEKSGDLREALRSYETTARLLGRLRPESEPLPLSKVNAGTLLEAVHSRLDAIRPL